VARRSVSLPPELERAVRLLQARLLTTMDRDISFNEALNLALAASFAVPDLASEVDKDQWAKFLAGSDWESDGVISDAGREVLNNIVPPSTPAKLARPKRPRRPPTKSARKPRARAASPATPPVVEAIAEPPVAAADEPAPVIVEPEAPPEAPSAAAVPTPKRTEEAVDDLTMQAFASAVAEMGKGGPVSGHLPTPDEEPPQQPVEEALAEHARDADVAETTEADSEPDSDPETERPSIPLPSSSAEPASFELVNEEPASDAPTDDSPPEPKLDPEPEPEAEPEPTPEPLPSSGMNLDAIRQAIVAGETELPPSMRDASSTSRFSSEPRDANDFAAMMSGFASSGPATESSEVIIPEVELPDPVFEPEPETPTASNSPPGFGGAPIVAESAVEETPVAEVDDAEEADAPEAEAPPTPDTGEPTAPAPPEQAADYMDLDKALKDAAAAYEERLRNSGAT
jgi:hypothetical protein